MEMSLEVPGERQRTTTWSSPQPSWDKLENNQSLNTAQLQACAPRSALHSSPVPTTWGMGKRTGVYGVLLDIKENEIILLVRVTGAWDPNTEWSKPFSGRQRRQEGQGFYSGAAESVGGGQERRMIEEHWICVQSPIRNPLFYTGDIC